MYQSEFPPYFLWVITPHFFNRSDEIRGAQGNGEYYILRPLTNKDFSFAGTNYEFELVGVGEGNTLEWSSVNGKLQFITGWHLSAWEHPETTNEWNGKIFEALK